MKLEASHIESTQTNMIGDWKHRIAFFSRVLSRRLENAPSICVVFGGILPCSSQKSTLHFVAGLSTTGNPTGEVASGI